MRHRYRMPHPGTAHAPCLPVPAHRQAAPRDSTVLIVPHEIRSPRCVALPYATAPAGTLARLQSSVATYPEVLLRPLCWCGAQPCFLKGLGGRLWRVCPLVSRMAVLMMRQLKRRGKTMSGLAQQRYAKSHRIFANVRCTKDFSLFRSSQGGCWFSQSVLGA